MNSRLYIILLVIVLSNDCTCRPLRSMFTDYLDGWMRFVNSTIHHLPAGELRESQCVHHLHSLVDAAADRESWAVHMFDSMGKPTSGILQESLSFIGLYSECVNGVTELFQGQYCLARVNLPQSAIQELQILSGLPESSWINAQPRLGICSPSSCTMEQINQLSNFAITRLISNSSISFSTCYVKNEYSSHEFQTPMYLTVYTFFLLFLLVILLSTIYECSLSIESETTSTSQEDESDANSLCTQCSKCSGISPSPFATGLTIPKYCNDINEVNNNNSSSTNNNFPNNKTNNWCICDSMMLSGEGIDHTCNNLSMFIGRELDLFVNSVNRSENNLQSQTSITESNTTEEETKSSNDFNWTKKFILCFSAKSNYKKLFNVNQDESDNSINCLHGVKFLCMVWVIFGHSYSFALQWLFFSNPNEIKQASTHLLSQVFANGTFSVDCFFFISGLLICLYGMKTIVANGGKLNIPVYYLYRYLRLTPLMLVVVAFSANIFRTIGEGPAWLESIQMYDGWCRKNWWINALYLHNFVNREEMCLSHSWYSAVDMQFYILSPFLLIPLVRYPRAGLALIGALFTGSVITTAVLTIVNNYPAVPYISGSISQVLLNEYYGAIYIKPYCRIGPFLIGFLVGYLIYKKNGKINIGPIKHMIFSTFSVMTLLFVVFAMYGANNGKNPPLLFAAAYSALARTLFCGCLAYLIVCILSGKMRTLNYLLSLPIVQPLSRVSHAAYLVHPLVMATFYGTQEQVFHFSHYLMFYFIVGHLFITYACSFLLSICFEMPFINLSRLLLRS